MCLALVWLMRCACFGCRGRLLRMGSSLKSEDLGRELLLPFLFALIFISFFLLPLAFQRASLPISHLHTSNTSPTTTSQLHALFDFTDL